MANPGLFLKIHKSKLWVKLTMRTLVGQEFSQIQKSVPEHFFSRILVRGVKFFAGEILDTYTSHWYSLWLGHPVPDGIPYGLADFFSSAFFFLPAHFRWPFVVKKTTDWAESLQNHTYEHASGRGTKMVLVRSVI